MKIYTTEDFKTFERDENGRLICPSGDYSQIKDFGDRSVFGDDCNFGWNCDFGSDCIFGRNCDFDSDCIFGRNCDFGSDCYFGLDCNFGLNCNFGAGCHFGAKCGFGNGSAFGDRSDFGVNCNFGQGCRFENNVKFESMSETTLRFLKIDRIGSRLGCTYFFKTASDIYVRCGCFFGTIADFEKKVNETHERNKKYRKEYLETIKYVKAVM